MTNSKRVLAETMAGLPAGKHSTGTLGPAVHGTVAWLCQHRLLINGVLGVALGAYLWQFLGTNQDFTGPLPIGLPLGLALTFLIGPFAVGGIQMLSALILARWTGRSRQESLHCDALSLLPLALLGLSPLLGLLTGWHSTAYHAAVVVLVSLAFSGCLALKAATAWRLGLRLNLDGRGVRYMLAGLTVIFVLVFSTLQVLRYNAYQLWGVDHTRVSQALWNTLHGRFLQFNFVNGVNTNLLADHFEPIYLLLVPFYWLWSDPRLLLFVQVFAVSCAAWPLFRMAQRRLQSSTLALGWALFYLLLPMTLWAAQDSGGAIRTDTLVILIFMFMLDALDRKDWPIFVVLVILVLATKEYFSLLVAALGLYIAFRHRQRMFGFSLFVVGLLWFVIVIQWVMPAITQGPSLTITKHVGQAAGEKGLVGLTQMLGSDPGLLVARIIDPNHFLFLFFLAFSLGGLLFVDPPMAAVSLPLILILAIATRPSAVTLGNFHYFPILPFLLVAALNGTVTVARWLEGKLGQDRRLLTVALTGFVLGMGLASSFFWSDSPLGWHFWDRRLQGVYWKDVYLPTEHVGLVDKLLESISNEAPVLASDYLLPSLSNRAELYVFYRPPDDVLARVDYVVVDLLQNRVRTAEVQAREDILLNELVSGSSLALIAYEDGLLFFERDATGGYISQGEVLPQSPQPQVRLEWDLGGRLRLLGYDPPADSLQAGERYRVTFYWQVLDGFDAPFAIKLGVNPESAETHQVDYVLADRFAGPSGEFGVLHLPTYIQVPPKQWQPGQIIRETYEFRLPTGAHGRYAWSVGLYAVPRFWGIRFDDERLVPGTEPIVLDVVQVQP